jgi:hypothetical protein
MSLWNDYSKHGGNDAFGHDGLRDVWNIRRPCLLSCDLPPLQTKGRSHMAKAKKAKRTAARTSARSTKTTTRRAVGTRAKRASSRKTATKTGVMSGLLDFIPANLMQNVLGSQTSRVIMAEVLVAAAGAAAAVLAASRTDTGQKAGKALADGGALMKEAAASAAAAARDVIANGATEAIGSAARSLMGAVEETQQDIAAKALRLKREAGDDGHDMAENARRHRERDRPH